MEIDNHVSRSIFLESQTNKHCFWPIVVRHTVRRSVTWLSSAFIRSPPRDYWTTGVRHSLIKKNLLNCVTQHPEVNSSCFTVTRRTENGCRFDIPGSDHVLTDGPLSLQRGGQVLHQIYVFYPSLCFLRDDFHPNYAPQTWGLEKCFVSFFFYKKKTLLGGLTLSIWFCYFCRLPAWGLRVLEKPYDLHWEVKGRENMVEGSGSVILMNHQSFVDLFGKLCNIDLMYIYW